MGDRRGASRDSWGNLRNAELLEGLGFDRIIILAWLLGKLDGKR
jgi:hypothetical protein